MQQSSIPIEKRGDGGEGGRWDCHVAVVSTVITYAAMSLQFTPLARTTASGDNVEYLQTGTCEKFVRGVMSIHASEVYKVCVLVPSRPFYSEI